MKGGYTILDIEKDEKVVYVSDELERINRGVLLHVSRQPHINVGKKYLCGKETQGSVVLNRWEFSFSAIQQKCAEKKPVCSRETPTGAVLHFRYQLVDVDGAEEVRDVSFKVVGIGSFCDSHMSAIALVTSPVMSLVFGDIPRILAYHF